MQVHEVVITHFLTGVDTSTLRLGNSVVITHFLTGVDTLIVMAAAHSSVVITHFLTGVDTLDF